MVKPKGDKLAELYTRINTAANHHGRVLHDDVGPLLSAAGLHLQLLRMDHPETEREIEQVNGILDQVYERIRAVSQELAPSPVLRGGLKNALERMAESYGRHPGLPVRLKYEITAELPVDSACALYAAAHAAVETAGSFDATRIAITAGGSRQVSIRIADNGRTRGRAKALDMARRIAEAQGLLVTVATKQGTIVSIRYALRSPTGR